MFAGDYYGKGSVREHELYTSAMTLGIWRDHIEVINDRNLQDRPGLEWCPNAIIKHISTALEHHGNIKTVSTWKAGVCLV